MWFLNRNPIKEGGGIVGIPGHVQAFPWGGGEEARTNLTKWVLALIGPYVSRTQWEPDVGGEPIWDFLAIFRHFPGGQISPNGSPR